VRGVHLFLKLFGEQEPYFVERRHREVRQQGHSPGPFGPGVAVLWRTSGRSYEEVVIIPAGKQTRIRDAARCWTGATMTSP
jgi:hypothetical protein